MSSSELSKLNGITKDKEAYYIFTSPEKEKGFISYTEEAQDSVTGGKFKFIKYRP
jgi:hypothetical protein